MLVSPEGAPLDARVVDALAGHTAYAQAGAPVSAAKVVGHVVKMTGSASIVRNGVAIVANTGDTLYQNDVVQTGSNSTMGMVLDDGSAFNLSASARCMLNDLVYDPAGSSNKSLFTLVQGAVSFVAGQVAPTGDMEVATPVAVIGIRGTAVLLDIGSTDGRVAISVADQQDGSVHAVQVFRCAPTNIPGVCTAGDQIGTVTSNGPAFSITPGANLQISTQEISKTPAQVTQEFSAFQQVLSTYDAGKQLFPNLPQHTENLNHDNNANPGTTRTAVGSAPILPSEPPTTTVFDNAATRAVADSGSDSIAQAVASATSGSVGSGSITPQSQTLSLETSQIVFVKETAPPAPVEIINTGGQINQTVQTITGTVDAAYAGTTIAILDTYNGVTTTLGTATVSTGGTWSTSVTLTGIGSHSIVAQDATANSTSVPVMFMLDTTAPSIAITNTGGATNQAVQTISGTVDVADAGATVTIFDGTTAVGMAIVQSNGIWSSSVTLAGGINSLTAEVTDTAGNTGTSPAVTFTLATTAPSIAIAAPVAGDNVINKAEAAAGVTISGTATAGSAAVNGQTATITLVDGGNAVKDTYTATVSNGAWSVNVSAAQAQALADGSYSIRANVSDAAGNAAPTATQVIAVDETAPVIAITAPVAGDNIVNKSEAAAGVTISGTATAGSAAINGQTATITIVDGSSAVKDTYTTTVSNGAWSVNVTAAQAQALVDGSYSIKANVSDAAGNAAPTASQAIALETIAPTVAIAAPVASDNIINKAEAASGVTISGTATAGSAAINGQTATITLVDGGNAVKDT